MIVTIFALLLSPVVTEESGASASAPSPPDEYVGSFQCARCHSAIFKSFSQTGMGRSMENITPQSLGSVKIPSELYDAKLDRHFAVFAKDERVYQSEFQTASDGTEIFRETQELKWKMGAGENGFGAIVESDHTLFQAPLSFYAGTGEWGLSPGYEFGDYGFNRPILAACASCHGGRPRPIANTNGRYDEPEFSQLAIGCENCHGPGQEHIRRMDAAKKQRASGDPAIVNPSDLSMPMANQICMSCHELGDVRVYKESKTYQDFRPGTPLDRVVSVFLVPPRPESPPQADHLEHYYAMTLSKCYRASGGKMGCISCHDPHVELSVQEAPAFFNSKCMQCHSVKSCPRVRQEEMHGEKSEANCIACHMPRRNIQSISHSTVTSHRILARQDEGFPDEAFHATTEASPELIHLNPDPNAANDPVPPITLLQAYGELAANRKEYAAPYLRVLEKLENTDPNHSIVQAALGRRDLLSGEYQQAATHFRRALEIGPPQAATYDDLAEAEMKTGDAHQAVTDLGKGIELDPFNPILQKKMVVHLIALKRYSEAKAAIQKYLNTFPQDSTMRKALQMAEQNPGDRP